MQQECPVAWRFGALTAFLETLQTIRFTEGFRTLDHTKWREFANVQRSGNVDFRGIIRAFLSLNYPKHVNQSNSILLKDRNFPF